MLGRDYSSDSKSFWMAAEIFFQIISKISLNEKLIKSKMEIINEVFSSFGENCIPYCLSGFSNKSFYKIFPRPYDQRLALFTMISTSKDKKAQILADYLIHSDIGLHHLDIVLEIIKEKKFDFIQDVFSQVASETAHDYLKKKFDSRKLSLLNRYARDKKLLPKTQMCILSKILFQF